MPVSNRCRLRSRSADSAAQSHVGLVRPTNQDRFCLRQMKDGSTLLAVADGLGGVPAGDIAADIVLNTLLQTELLTNGTDQNQLVDLALRLDHMVADATGSGPDLGGMGSTLTLVWQRHERACWVQVGDSRLYLLRNRKLRQLTQDQTLARFLVAEGEITPEQVGEHYSKEVLDQYLGCGHCEPEAHHIHLMEGDILLLSSDGLHRLVAVEPLEAFLNARNAVTEKARSLIQAALDAGGIDNITAVVARMTLDRS